MRLIAALAALFFLAVAVGIRVLAGDGILSSAGPVAQHSGTALYAALIYAGAFVAAPRLRPPVAGALAVVFCWAVELFQLTDVPRQLSEQSIVARLVLGARFDPVDLLWYPVGVLPLVALHQLWARREPEHPMTVPERVRRGSR